MGMEPDSNEEGSSWKELMRESAEGDQEKAWWRILANEHPPEQDLWEGAPQGTRGKPYDGG